jgi:hypothetical protein
MIALLHFFELSRKTVLPLYFFIVKSLFSTLTGRFDYFIVKLKLLASFSIFFFFKVIQTQSLSECAPTHKIEITVKRRRT